MIRSPSHNRRALRTGRVWVSRYQALYFDLRKGAQSIGSNVRDAAAHVIWALARSQNQSALVPHAANLEQRLATVALFDREIHIRRAASAAFQEHVGRTVSSGPICYTFSHIDFYCNYENARTYSLMVLMCWGRLTSMRSVSVRTLFWLQHLKLPCKS